MRKQRGYIDPELVVIIVILAGIVAAPWWIISLIAKEQRKWEAFKAEHHCKIVGHVSDSVGVGSGITFDSKGNVAPIMTTTYTPAKTGWQCNDGVTYWR